MGKQGCRDGLRHGVHPFRPLDRTLLVSGDGRNDEIQSLPNPAGSSSPHLPQPREVSDRLNQIPGPWESGQDHGTWSATAAAKNGRQRSGVAVQGEQPQPGWAIRPTQGEPPVQIELSWNRI